MKKYSISWKDTREVSTTIFAENKEEAKEKWERGEYEQIEVDDQDICSEGEGGFFEITEEVSGDD